MGSTWGQLGDKLIALAIEKRVPITGQFELTSRCNLECKMCYICNPINGKLAISLERTAEEWIQLARDARDAGLLYLLLTGGEVFIRKDFMKIYEELSLMGFCIEIYTNATMITPEIAKRLGQIPPLKVGVTLYGSFPEVYEKVCGFAGGHELAIKGIDLLLAEGINVELKTTVIKRNKDDFDKIAEFAQSRGLEFGIVNYISPRRDRDNKNPEAERLSPQEFIDYEMKVEKYFEGRENNLEAVKQTEECLVIDNRLLHGSDSPFSCSVGKCSFWVTWDGYMTTCGLSNDPAALPFEKGFLEAWVELQELCAAIPKCAECIECELKGYCLTCPARLKSETDFYDKPAPYLCELARKEKNWRNP